MNLPKVSNVISGKHIVDPRKLLLHVRRLMTFRNVKEDDIFLKSPSAPSDYTKAVEITLRPAGGFSLFEILQVTVRPNLLPPKYARMPAEVLQISKIPVASKKPLTLTLRKRRKYRRRKK